MKSEQNFRECITREWIDSVRRRHVEMKVSIAALLSFCSNNSIYYVQPEFSEQIELKNLVNKHAKDSGWNENQIRWAYGIAHQEIYRIAVKMGYASEKN